MARSWTRAQIRTRARFHADLEGADVGVLDLRVNELLDTHKCTVYLELFKAGSPNYYAADFPITVASGVVPTALPADFLAEVQVLRVVDSNRKIPIGEMEDHDIGYYQPPQSGYSAVMEYVPSPTIWTQDSDTFDGIAGYEELIAKLTARDMLRKESSIAMAQALDDSCERLLTRIRSTAKRSVHSRLIRDVDTEAAQPWYWSGTANVNAFRIRAGNIELYDRRIRL